MMGIDEQRRAAAVAAEHFQQPAIRSLRKAQTTAIARQASAEYSQPAKSRNHRLWNLRLAIDRHRIDLARAEFAQPLGQLGRRRLVRRVGIRQDAIAQVLPKKPAFDEADLLQP